MAQTTNLSIKIDLDLKAQADKLFAEMGMSFAAAINMLVRQAVREHAIPHRVFGNTETVTEASSIEQRRAAMREIRELLAGVDGSSIDLDLMQAKRRAAKYERAD